ncbi:hypothetical protein GF367_02670 [Candidatus Woesearchaeota archaeon]|nr:hypothetical protein [Candidatus Woesearchaeota archaeon]
MRDAHCPRCKKPVSEPWKSEFWGAIHYITMKCDHCKYQLFYKADFISSGIGD